MKRSQIKNKKINNNKNQYNNNNNSKLKAYHQKKIIKNDID